MWAILYEIEAIHQKRTVDSKCLPKKAALTSKSLFSVCVPPFSPQHLRYGAEWPKLPGSSTCASQVQSHELLDRLGALAGGKSSFKYPLIGPFFVSKFPFGWPWLFFLGFGACLWRPLVPALRARPGERGGAGLGHVGARSSELGERMCTERGKRGACALRRGVCVCFCFGLGHLVTLQPHKERHNSRSPLRGDLTSLYARV
jgi:hypothetical protein